MAGLGWLPSRGSVDETTPGGRELPPAASRKSATTQLFAKSWALNRLISAETTRTVGALLIGHPRERQPAVCSSSRHQHVPVVGFNDQAFVQRYCHRRLGPELVVGRAVGSNGELTNLTPDVRGELTNRSSGENPCLVLCPHHRVLRHIPADHGLRAWCGENQPPPPGPPTR